MTKIRTNRIVNPVEEMTFISLKGYNPVTANINKLTPKNRNGETILVVILILLYLSFEMARMIEAVFQL